MSRELKFRVWDSVAKKMYYGELEQFDDMLGFRLKHFECECEKPDYTQYTGLKDKKGKEIWEGDIILRHRTNEKLEIIFEEGVFRPKGYAQINAWDDEVIGNKFENPELLKEIGA